MPVTILPIAALPTDPDPILRRVLVEQALRANIILLAQTIPFIANAYTRERLPDEKNDDIALTTTLDQITQLPVTNVMEIVLTDFDESEYTGGDNTQLIFYYDITWDKEFVDKYVSDNPADDLNSTDAFNAGLMMFGYTLKKNPQLGYDNVTHRYLQGREGGLALDDETLGRFHTIRMSLDVVVSGTDL